MMVEEKEKERGKDLDPCPDLLPREEDHHSRYLLSCIGNECKQAHACIVEVPLINGEVVLDSLAKVSLQVI
jgi:hypothetical protein